MIEWLTKPLELFGFIPTNWLEILAFITGIFAVGLAAKNRVSQWPWGIINSVLFLFVFIEVGLYADAGLMIFYVLTCVYGWYWYLRGGANKTELPTRRVNFLPFGEAPVELRRFDNLFNNFWVVAILTGVAWYVMGTTVDRITTSDVAFWDAGTTALSLAAQVFLMRRLLENWFIWMTVDVMYIGLYWYKELYFTSFLYLIFLCICVFGYFKWRKDEEADAVELPRPGVGLAAEVA